MFKSLLLKGRTLCLLLCCIVSSLVVTAQTKHTGKVISSDDKQPVVGASVRIKGTNTGSVTDVNGDFTLSLSPGNVIEISYIGYITKDVTVKGGEFITISLDPSSSTLNEVVVTGYTSQLKKDISGSVGTVDVSDAKKIPVSSSEELLQGNVSGVTVINSGAPGAASTVFIRGISNFGATAPLYIVDGAQVGDMSLVNPNDIESISVLKDAGSAAVYGVAGGNGVVLITTKHGKAGKSTISYDGFYGVQQPLSGNVWNLMNPEQQSSLAFTAGDNATEALYPGGPGTIPTYGYHGAAAPAGSPFGAAGVTSNPAITQYYNFNANNPGQDFLVQQFATGAGNDWFHDVFTAEPTEQHTLTASGGNDKSTYLMSLNYINQTGTLLSTYEHRLQVRVNTTTSALNNHIRFGESGFVTYRQNNGGYNGSTQSEGDIISYTYREMPLIPTYDIAGNFGGGFDGPNGEPLGNGSNPYAIGYRSTPQQGTHANFVTVEGSVFVEADINKYITLRSSVGGLLYNQYYYGITYNTYENFESHTSANGASENEQYSTNYNWTTTVNYKENFGKHKLNVLAGYEQKDNVGRGVGASNNNYFSLDPNYITIGAATVVAAPYSYINQPVGILSVFGKLDYSYDDKYIIGASIRRDGTSEFYPGKQWGTFPSVSAAWRISQESFMKGISWLNDLKILGSWGEAGNYQNVPAGNPYNLYSSGFGSSYYGFAGNGGGLSQGFYNSQLGNQNTTWEIDKATNVGFNASIFNHFDISVEYYKKVSDGLLFQAQLPAVLGGANAPDVNIGNVQNQGADISVTYHTRINKDVTFSATANITTYASLITKESTTSNNFQQGYNRDNPITLDQVGHPIGEFYGYITNGIYQNAQQVASLPGYSGAAPGYFIYKDVANAGSITSADETFMGNPNPQFTYGLNLNATYKRFDISMVLYGSQGNKDYNYTKYWTDFYGTFQGGKSIDLYDKAAIIVNGQNTVPNAILPMAGNLQDFGSALTSSFYVENGSFLKCRVLQLGYTFDPNLIKAIGFSKLHLYVQATNLFTITKYDGLDPELIPSLANGAGSAAFGIDYGSYPNNQRQFIVGANLSF